MMSQRKQRLKELSHLPSKDIFFYFFFFFQIMLDQCYTTCLRQANAVMGLRRCTVTSEPKRVLKQHLLWIFIRIFSPSWVMYSYYTWFRRNIWLISVSFHSLSYSRHILTFWYTVHSLFLPFKLFCGMKKMYC